MRHNPQTLPENRHQISLMSIICWFTFTFLIPAPEVRTNMTRSDCMWFILPYYCSIEAHMLRQIVCGGVFRNLGGQEPPRPPPHKPSITNLAHADKQMLHFQEKHSLYQVHYINNTLPKVVEILEESVFRRCSFLFMAIKH